MHNLEIHSWNEGHSEAVAIISQDEVPRRAVGPAVLSGPSSKSPVVRIAPVFTDANGSISFALTVLLLLFCTVEVRAQETGPDHHVHSSTNAVTLNATYITSLAEQMRTNHPALQAAAKRIEASQANAASVRRWDNPTFRLGGLIAGESLRADEGDIIYGVEQKLPVFGKEKQERAVADAGIAVTEREREAGFRQLRLELTKALYATAYASRAVQVAQEDIRWLQTLEQTAEAQYRFGNGMQSDVLRVQNELAKRRDESLTEERMLHHAWFTLNRFVNQPLTNAWPEFKLPELADSVAYTEQLAASAVQNEPKVHVLREQLQVADQDIALAKARRRPDLGVGVQARNYTGTGELRSGEIVLSLSLPLFNRERYRQDVVREQSKKQALEKDISDAELEIRHQLHDVTVRLDAARREALLYQDNIIPRTRQMLDSLYAAWQANTGPLRDILEVRRTLLQAELSRAKAISTQYQALSELAYLLGAASPTDLSSAVRTSDSDKAQTKN